MDYTHRPTTYDVYCYDPDTGEYVDGIPGVAEDRYKALAGKLAHHGGYHVKVYQGIDVVYTYDAPPR